MGHDLCGRVSTPLAGMSKYRAIIFDLWGTLVDDLNHPEANRLRSWQRRDEIADLLGADRNAFAGEWAAGVDRRMVGAFSSTEDMLAHICGRLGVEPRRDRVRAGAGVWYSYIRGALHPRPGTVETLSVLRESGYRVGLISNCTEEFSRLWHSTPFAPLLDAVVLSFEVGLAKPDLRIYETAAERLGVSAGHCLYVGDGSGGELTGASQAGMTAVLMRAPYDQADGDREGWTGARISDTRDVLDLL